MRFDKETLIKHRFWVMLAAMLPLVLIAIIVLMTVVTGDIYAHRKTIDETLNALKAPLPDIKNDEHIKLVEKLADDLEKQEEKVWGEVYNEQKELTFGVNAWPTAFNSTFHFHDGLFARRIQVYRGKPAGPPPETKNAWFVGAVGSVYRDYIDVTGTGSEFKEPVQKRFYRTAKIKVTLADDMNQARELNFFQMASGDNVQIIYQVGKYFNDPLTVDELSKFGKHYRDQIGPILDQVEPVNEKGEGVVQFKDWTFRRGEMPPDRGFLKYVAREWDLARDFPDEAWVAQEDLWIQREIYRMVRMANDFVARFMHEGGDGIKAPAVFANPYWKLELQVAKDKSGNDVLKTRATNMTTRRQSLDVPLWINFSEPRATEEAKKLSAAEWGAYREQNFVKVILPGEPLNPNGYKDSSRDLEPIPLQLDAAPRQIYNVEQVLNWKTAGVKRIDEIAIGEHSHRTIVKGLKPLKEPKADPAAVVDPLNPIQPPPEARQLGQKAELSPHGLLMARYSEVTPQGRRVPVGVSMIVDQLHVSRVLAAFANSNLRLVTTQVMQNHYPSSVRPQVIFQPKGPQGFPQPPLRGGQVEGGIFNPPFQGFPNQPQVGGDDQEANIELVIYGTMTLYERHPPKVLEADEVQTDAPAVPDPSAQPVVQ